MALSRPAFEEAINHFQRGVECVGYQDSTQTLQNELLELLVKLSNASTARYGYSHPETVRVKAEARKVLDDVSETPHRIPLLYGSWVTNHVNSNHLDALNDADTLCREAVRSGDRLQGLIGYRLRGSSHEMMGEFTSAEKDFARAFDFNDPESDAQLAGKFGSDPGVSIRICWAISLLCRGEGRRAMELIDGIEENARVLGQTNAYAYTLFHLSWLYSFASQPDRKRLINLSNEFSLKYDLKMWNAYSFLHAGAYLHDQGQFVEAEEQFRRGFDLTNESHVLLMVPLHHAVHASTLAALGRLDEAMKVEQLVLTMIDELSEQISTAEIWRLLANIHYWHHDNMSKAVDGLQRAKELSAKQGAELWNLRASTSLAKIWADQGKVTEAQHVLNEAITRFPSGGRDLIDWKLANAQIQSLGVVS